MRRALLVPVLTAALSGLTVVTPGARAASAAPPPPAPTVVVNRAPAVLAGAKTGLTGALDVDTVGSRTYVLQADSVRIYPAYATGNTAPVASISGLSQAAAITVATDGAVYVLETDFSSTSQVVVYTPQAGGYAAPVTYTSAQLGTQLMTDISAIGNDVAILDLNAEAVDVYDLESPIPNAPLRTIGPADSNLANGFAIATQPNGAIAVAGYGYVETFAATAQGPTAAPVTRIAGSHTGLVSADSVGFDSAGAVYVGNITQAAARAAQASDVLMWKRGLTGDVAPTAALKGAKTGFGVFNDIDVAPNRSITALDFDGGAQPRVKVFRALGPYAVPGKVAKLKVSGKASKPKRTVTWKAAVTNADVPVTHYSVKVSCGKKKLAKTLKPTAHKLVLGKAKLKPGTCHVAISATNMLGTGKVATKSFHVARKKK